MSRLQDTLDAVAERGEKAMGLFLTSGFPDLDSTLPVLRAMDAGGADFIELGMPFSDPLAEGLPIQRSSERALKAGVRMRHALETASAFSSQSETPLLLMGYINPIHRYGAAQFCRDAKRAGVDGLILADLPINESHLIADEAHAADLGIVHLIAPNTNDDRIRLLDGAATAFIYAVSVTGLTGSGLGSVDGVARYLERARSIVKQNPLLVGFGIRTRKDAARLSEHTDGFIVGSALIECVEEAWDDPALSNDERLEHVRRFVRSLKYGDGVPVE